MRTPSWSRPANSREPSDVALLRAAFVSSSGGVPEQKLLATKGRAILLHHLDGKTDEPLGKAPRIGDGGRAQDELRRAAIPEAQSTEPAHDVRHVRAEDPPVDVSLVQHHVAQVSEQLGPALVVGQNAQVEHIRVGQHHLRPLLDLPPSVGRGITVEDIGTHRNLVATHLSEAAQLVLRQGLRRSQVQRPAGGVCKHRFKDGQQIAEALPAGRTRGHNDMAALPHGVNRLRLVPVERMDTAPLKRRLQPLVQGPVKHAVLPPPEAPAPHDG